MVAMSKLAVGVLAAAAPAAGFFVSPAAKPLGGRVAISASPQLRMQTDIERKTGDNVEQIKDTKRDKVRNAAYVAACSACMSARQACPIRTRT